MRKRAAAWACLPGELPGQLRDPGLDQAAGFLRDDSRWRRCTLEQHQPARRPAPPAGIVCLRVPRPTTSASWPVPRLLHHRRGTARDPDRPCRPSPVAGPCRRPLLRSRLVPSLRYSDLRPPHTSRTVQRPRVRALRAANAALPASTRAPSAIQRTSWHTAPGRGERANSAHGQPARRLTIEATTNL